ncbi:MAG: ATP-dependent Clp protease ATP-binding subunit [Candidatus Levyibacteriota bacterium]
MKGFAKFYFYYTSSIIILARLLLFILFAVGSAFLIINKFTPNIFLLLLGLMLVFEIFFKYKIAKTNPKVEVLQNTGDPLDSFSLELLGILETQKTVSQIIKQLINLPQMQFIILKADLKPEGIILVDGDKQTLIQSTFNLAKEAKGKYVTAMDYFIAYLLLIEPSAKILFNHKLKEEDLKNILAWARHVHTEEESPKQTIVNFAGEGIAEEWVYGWTLETKKYMLDLSHEFLSGRIEPMRRVNEFQQLTEALFKGDSVILVGDAGSGKEATVKELAIESFMGRLKNNLYHQKIYQLMVDAFMAGAQNQGEIEARINALITEIAHSGDTIIYIPEFQNTLGSSTFHLDISGALIPYLQKKEIRIIATVTPGAYKTFLEPMKTLLDNFTVINFSEPSKEEVLQMLFQKAAVIEEKDNAVITYKAVLAACNFADRYSKEKVLPGSAVTLLEDTANADKVSGKRIVEEQDILSQIEKKIRVPVGEPKPIEKTLLLNLENEIHKRVVDQEEAVFAISEAIRRLRTGLNVAEKPISFLFLGPTGVGKTETAKALAAVYFGQGARMIRLDMSEFVGEEGIKKLLGSAPGEGSEKGELEMVYDNPNSLVLLDEFEKADQQILNLFLQVLDDGRLTDDKGKTVSFANCIIIATSNAASEFIREEVGKGVQVNKQFQQNLINYLETKGIFKPELLNRFDDIITFKPLGQTEITQIVKLMLIGVAKELAAKDITVYFDEKIIVKIVNEGFDKDFGARPLRRFIQDKIEDLIAQAILKDEIKRGDKIQVSVDSTNNISVNKP